jgi:two-component system sensor histidine kinase HydH
VSEFRDYLRVSGPAGLASLLLVGLGTGVAVTLFRVQAGLATALGENVDSRRAASDLEEALEDLRVLQRGGADHLGPLRERVEEHLQTIRHLADKPEEEALARRLGEALDHYRDAADPAAAVAVLQREALPFAHALSSYNAREIERSERAWRATLRGLAFGLAGVGILGGAAGAFLGYAVARALRRSILRLQVRVRDAAGRLAPDLPDVVVSRPGGLEALDADVGNLVHRIEEVVERLQQREHEVLRAEQLAAVGQLAAGVAHEVRNPLTSIKMLVQSAREEAAGPVADDLAVVEREVRRIERSLQAFLDFARPPRPERRPHDLATLATDTLALVRGRANNQRVELTFEHPPGPVTAAVDADQVRQVLVNLLLNALDAMPGGGRLVLGLRRDAGWAELTVTDTGPGIDPKVAPRLFEPFVSDKETGLGLGLVTSRRLVEVHGGRLVGENRPGGGATFTVRLPLAAGAGAGGGHADALGDR